MRHVNDNEIAHSNDKNTFSSAALTGLYDPGQGALQHHLPRSSQRHERRLYVDVPNTDRRRDGAIPHLHSRPLRLRGSGLSVRDPGTVAVVECLPHSRPS